MRFQKNYKNIQSLKWFHPHHQNIKPAKTFKNTKQIKNHHLSPPQRHSYLLLKGKFMSAIKIIIIVIWQVLLLFIRWLNSWTTLFFSYINSDFVCGIECHRHNVYKSVNDLRNSEKIKVCTVLWNFVEVQGSVWDCGLWCSFVSFEDSLEAFSQSNSSL